MIISHLSNSDRDYMKLLFFPQVVNRGTRSRHKMWNRFARTVSHFLFQSNSTIGNFCFIQMLFDTLSKKYLSTFSPFNTLF